MKLVHRPVYLSELSCLERKLITELPDLKSKAGLIFKIIENAQ
ncbi:hypothetical protein BTN50_0107 [Candidatus Enterovibrio altilux]|uniref:Uncharacterized protein n=1 Tax=Candidatus Enterovibrio altilux TaxID=1927128 RepID=A0A291B6N4_9GAMM|nr:hypothetical protein BTN50_0107 [Candidatus Enterovibrio luxaltus]